MRYHHKTGTNRLVLTRKQYVLTVIGLTFFLIISGAVWKILEFIFQYIIGGF